MYNRYIPGGEFTPMEEKRGTKPSLGGFVQSIFRGGAPKVEELLKKLRLDRFDKGDILLALVLIYLYIDTDDEDWLIVLVLVVLMGF